MNENSNENFVEERIFRLDIYCEEGAFGVSLRLNKAERQRVATIRQEHNAGNEVSFSEHSELPPPAGFVCENFNAPDGN